MKVLHIVRGIPGSGKTTYAKSLGLKFHFEADKYMEVDGEYVFDPRKLPMAHAWCQKSVREAMETGEDIVVSNTFVKKWEMDPYLEAAEEFGYDVVERTMTGRYPNVHGCPEEKVEKMLANFEA